MTSNNKSMPHLFAPIISSSVGCLITSITLTPLDVVKVRQQASIHNFSKKQGTFRLLRHLFMKEGVRGMYASMPPALAMLIPSSLLYYTTYSEIVNRVRNQDLSNWVEFDRMILPITGGATARMVATTVTFPLELIRTRRALGQDSRPVIRQIREMLQLEGARSLYKGLGPTLWRDVPFSAVYFLSFEQTRRLLNGTYSFGGSEDKEEISSATLTKHTFLSGMVAGMIATLFTTPLDVIKTRRQMLVENTQCVCNNRQRLHPMSHRTNTTIIGQMRAIIKSDGVAGLWKANSTRMLKVAPAHAIMISSFEFGKQVCERGVTS